MSIVLDLATAASLSIDKITINYSIKDNSDLTATLNLIADLQFTGQFPIKITLGRFYRYNCIIPIDTVDNPLVQTVLLQVGSRRPQASDIRLEFNPAKLGPAGIDRLKEILASLELDPVEIFTVGIVSRLDVALDIFNLNADQVIARSDGHRKHAVYSDKNGAPESLYFGTPRSNRTVIYTKQHSNGRTSLRSERRVKGPYLLRDLPQIENPFSKVRLISTQALLPHLDGMIANQFFDSIRVRGFSHVVAELPAKQRRTLTGIIRDPQRSLLPAMDDIWAGWPDLVVAMFGPPETPYCTAPPIAPDVDDGQKSSNQTDA